ncbi:DUF1367 family protein [Lancefieldella rimae]|uniref:DUF1367 family protein n=1 Tax=Lancefieldella rimae TaxID=1383 RepID=UPI003A8DF064
MDFFCRVTPAGLVPLDDMDWEQKKQLRLGSDVRVHITMPRNLRFHKKFMALLRLTLDNLPEDIQQSMHIYSIEAMLAAVKIDLGYYDTVQVSGRNVVKLRSISFAKMDETAFERFYDLAVTDILNNYLQGADRNLLLQEVEETIG